MLIQSIVLVCLFQSPTSDELLKQASSAWAKKDAKGAAELADKAIAADPKNKIAYMFRGSLREVNDQFEGGIADWTKVLELDPAETEAYHARGSLNFKAGRVEASLADFDAFVKKRPERLNQHWQRGISCYYAGKYEEGKRQFEGYQEFDNADVENAVWRFMCMVRSSNLEKARAGMLKIGDDRRIPMRDIYDLYLGKKTPEDVLAAAVKGDLEPGLKNRQLFYAHLYLGIWFDLLGERAKAIEHLNKAANDHRIPHYMWDVARVHRDRLVNEKK